MNITPWNRDVPLTRRLATHAPALAIGLLWLLALALTAWTLAGWFWQRRAEPPRVAASITDPMSASREVANRHLFGEARRVIAEQPVATQHYTLLGVAAPTRSSWGFAILQEQNASPQGYLIGDTLAQGVVLSRILPDAVEIRRGGAIERIPLTAGASTGAGQPPGSARPGNAMPPLAPPGVPGGAPGYYAPPPPPPPQGGGATETPPSQ